MADLPEVVRTSIDRGCLRALEESLFRFELDSPGTKRPPSIEKLNESLLDSRPILISGKTFYLNRRIVLKSLASASLQSRDRVKLKRSCEKVFDSYKDNEVLDFISTLCRRGIKFETFVGVMVDSMFFHYSHDHCRFKHALGLADAVHLSMFNLGVQVKFPGRVLRTHSPNGLDSLVGKRIRFSVRHSSYKTVYNRPTTESRHYRLLLHYLRIFPKGLREVQYVKLIKTSLVFLFCDKMNQELPPLTSGKISIFPDTTQERLDRLFMGREKDSCRFYKNLLESKSLCAEVGEDMVKEAYDSHRMSLCRPLADVPTVPAEILRDLFLYGRKVGKFVNRVYDPNRTKIPNTRATIEKSREKGGARAALEPRREVQTGPLFLDQMQGASRPEPFVIALFGPPGSGKTTTVSDLRHLLGSSLFPHLKKDVDQVYSRSCSTDHWDGYTGQPIVILDDFGQDQNNRSDIVEFEQLVSVNRYVVPMADLENKGQCFVSPIIILTSNMAFGSIIRSPDNYKIVEDDLAVWRRMHLPIMIFGSSQKFTSSKQLRNITWPDPEPHEVLPYQKMNREGLVAQDFWYSTWMDKYVGTPRDPQLSQCTMFGRTTFGKGNSYFQDKVPRLVGDQLNLCSLVDLCLSSFRRHTDYHESNLSSNWRQVVTRQRISVKQLAPPIYSVYSERIVSPTLPNDVTVSQLFPRFPPYHPPVVQAIAIKEPLKVRMITKAEAETKVLQPFQWALFEYLKTQPQFSLTHGVSKGFDGEFPEKLEWIYRIESEIQSILSRSDTEDLWLSGDYTSATDDFPMSVTNALIEGILSEISHEPTKMWVRYEVSPHSIRYPGGILGSQTSGQLMGSLLSFPLLCFLNDYIVRSSGFKEGSYMINGDDVVARGPLHTIQNWKARCPLVNLNLSLGKNFIHKEFCTVNSQLFWNGEVQHTGKVSCQTRHGKTLSRCFAETQFYYGNNDRLRREFIRRNLHALRDCPSSLDVPSTHGGLGLFWSGREGVDLSLAKRVYLCKFLQPLAKSYPVPGFDYLRALPIPTGIFSDEELRLGGGDPESSLTLDLLRSLSEAPDSESRDLSNADLRLYLEQTKHLPRLKNALHSHCFHLRKFPPLGSLRYQIIFVEKGKVSFLKNKSLQMGLNLLLDYLSDESQGRFDPDMEVEILLDELINTDNVTRLFSEGEPSQLDYVEMYSTDDHNRYLHLLPDIKPKIPHLEVLPHDVALLRLLSQPTELVDIPDVSELPELAPSSLVSSPPPLELLTGVVGM